MKAAILAEVQPHIKTLKDARNKLQSSVDAAKVSYFSNLCYIFFYLKRFRSICNTIICQIAFVEQVDHLGSLLDDVRVVDDSINEFAKLLKSYNIK